MRSFDSVSESHQALETLQLIKELVQSGQSSAYNYVITGREERFAKVGGEMVPLEKIEDELHLILKTNDKVCAVTAIPDAKKGERIIVLHVSLPETTPLALWKQLNERGLPNIYVPSQRDFFLVGELPILGSGKLDLKKCKQMAQQVAGTTE